MLWSVIIGFIKAHIEQVSGGTTASVAGTVAWVSGFASSAMQAVLIAALSAAVGALVGFFVKRWAHKKWPLKK